MRRVGTPQLDDKARVKATAPTSGDSGLPAVSVACAQAATATSMRLRTIGGAAISVSTIYSSHARRSAESARTCAAHATVNEGRVLSASLLGDARKRTVQG